MAENLTEFMKQLEAAEPPAFDAPQVYYGPEEDVLTCYFRPEEAYAHHLTNLVTLFLSFESNELVGCQVQGVRRKLDSDGTFGIGIKTGGKLELGLFFHLLAYEISQAEPRNRLVELGQRAKGIEVDTGKFALSN